MELHLFQKKKEHPLEEARAAREHRRLELTEPPQQPHVGRVRACELLVSADTQHAEQRAERVGTVVGE